MNISQFQAIDQTGDSLDQIEWEKVVKDVIKAYDLFFKIFVIVTILTYLAGKSLGNWVHRLNDWLAQQWVWLIVPSPSVETGQVPIVEEVLNNTPAVAKVEPTLPQESLSTLFNTPLMLAAAQAPVALLAPALQEQAQPSPRRRRRQSTPVSPPAVAVTEAAPTPTRHPRGPRAHQERKKNRQAA